MSRSFNQEVSLWQPETQAKLEKMDNTAKRASRKRMEYDGVRTKSHSKSSFAVKTMAEKFSRGWWHRAQSWAMLLSLLEHQHSRPRWSLQSSWPFAWNQAAYSCTPGNKFRWSWIWTIHSNGFRMWLYRAWHSTRPHVWTHLENHCREVECLCWFEQMCKQCITKLFLVTMVRYWPWTSAPFVWSMFTNDRAPSV